MKRCHIFVLGKVQGVFFRDFTVSTAERFGIVGWVRNLEDGRVELVAEGLESKLKQFIKELRPGPFLSVVEDMKIIWEQATDEFDKFSRR